LGSETVANTTCILKYNVLAPLNGWQHSAEGNPAHSNLLKQLLMRKDFSTHCVDRAILAQQMKRVA